MISRPSVKTENKGQVELVLMLFKLGGNSAYGGGVLYSVNAKS